MEKKKLKISHNLNDVELEEALQKALKGIRQHRELPKELPHGIAKQINDEGDKIYDLVIGNMINEIKRVMEDK